MVVSLSVAPTAPMILLEFSDERLRIQFGGLGRTLWWPLVGGLTCLSGFSEIHKGGKISRMTADEWSATPARAGKTKQENADSQKAATISAVFGGLGVMCSGLFMAWHGSTCNQWEFDKSTGVAVHRRARLWQPWSSALQTTYSLKDMQVGYLSRTTKMSKKSETSYLQTARIFLQYGKANDAVPVPLDARMPKILQGINPWPTMHLLSNAYFLSDFLAINWKSVSSQVLSTEEVGAASMLFDAVDHNKSGFMEKQELRRFGKSMPVELHRALGQDASKLTKINTDGWSFGVVERAETGMGALSDHMQVLDTNNDGRLSREEFNRWVKMRKATRSDNDPQLVEMLAKWQSSYVASIPSYHNWPIISTLLW